MFQWFIRKCIPLSFAKGELPFLAKWVQKRIAKSEVLQKERKKYQIHRSYFQRLQDQTLKQENFEDYWQELQTKLDNGSMHTKQPVATPRVSYTGIFLPRFAMACCLVLAIGLFVQPNIFTMEKFRTKNSTLTINFPKWINLKDKNSKLDELVPIDIHIKDMNIDVKGQNYQLDRVIQCKFESGTF